MFIPIGDTPNPRNFTPWTNWLLIAVNVAVYLLTLPLASQAVYVRSLGEYVSRYQLLVLQYGYKPGAPQWSDLFVSLFLHGGLLHLAGNMLFLWIYGDNVEYRLGRIGYVVTYLVTGVSATLFFALFAGASLTPMIGASGAISGVLGVYFLLFPRNKVKMFIALFPFIMNTVLLPARLVLGIFLLFDNVLPFLVGAQSGVAYGAHIGGFLAGLGIAWVGERFAWHFPWQDEFWRLGRPSKTRTSAAAGEEESVLAEIRSAITNHDFERAIKAIALLDRQEMAELRPQECVLLADWLERSGHPISATQLLRQCLAHHPGAENLADVYLVLGLMRLRQGQPTAAYQHLLSVFDYNPGPETAERARQALAQIDIFRRRT